jgi:hypothetical protein
MAAHTRISLADGTEVSVDGTPDHVFSELNAAGGNLAPLVSGDGTVYVNPAHVTLLREVPEHATMPLVEVIPR